MPELSVLIPARNEVFLQRTIDDILEHFSADIEIIVGLDCYEPDPPLIQNDKVRVYKSPDRIGMRPMINKLASMANGRYIMKTDAHCSFADGYDLKLIETHKPGCTVLGVRYLLDTPTWTRRERTNCDFRYLSHPDHDKKGGLRGTKWPEYFEKNKDLDVAPTMTISGSGWLMEKSQFEKWGGLDENHGTFGQEGAEISLKTWLTGGEVLVDRRTWYAHWNRGKSPYALGRKQVRKSIDYSVDLWLNDKWPQQTHSFYWLIEKFAPVPGWEMTEPEGIKAPRQGTLRKGYRETSPYKSDSTDIPVQRLWDNWAGISEPLKRHRLTILQKALLSLYQDGDESQYKLYLESHLDDDKKHPITEVAEKHVERKLKHAHELFESIKENGMRAPLEFYNQDGKMILWKGYRRLVVAKVLGRETIPCVIHKSEECKLQPDLFPKGVEPDSITDHAARQFARLGGLSTDKYWVHGYTHLYDKLIGHWQRNKIRMLELGVHRGASMLLWRYAFPSARIVGVDKDDSKWRDLAGDLKNTKVLIGNQRDKEFMDKVIANGPYHVIIDDCSHDPRIQRKTFEMLWPALHINGYYIIEDCHYSYQEGKENFMQKLAPLINSIYTDQSVSEVQFFYNLTAIRKGH